MVREVQKVVLLCEEECHQLILLVSVPLVL